MNTSTVQDPDILKKNPKIGSSNPEMWGIGERLVPDAASHDTTATTRTIIRILERHYETAVNYIQGKKVLDIACGTGYGSKMMKDAGAASVTGVDLSPEAVEYARERYATSGVDFVCCNAEEYESSEKYDVIISCETIEHLQRPDLFLARLHRMLTPGGTLLLALPLGETRHIDAYHLHAFSRKQILRMMANTGFVAEAERCDDWVITLQDFDEWKQLYPENQASFKDIFLTRRGLHLVWALIRGGGKLLVPQYFVLATASSEPVPPVTGKLRHLEG
jgi:ubiquinone/menaquinone biosynthesis C-methylase UbiE